LIIDGIEYIVLTERKPEELLGTIDYKAGIISINDEIGSVDRVNSVLLHEAFHAIADERGVEIDESGVLALSSGLFVFMVTNPEFIASLLNGDPWEGGDQHSEDA
jgi:hypothetical protein